MTVVTTESFVTYTGNGSTTVFPFNFLIQTGAIVVTLWSQSTGSVELASGSYSVTGLDSLAGGHIVYPLVGSPITNQYTLTIQRILAPVQSTDISNQANFYPVVIEDALDYLTYLYQDLKFISDRTVTLAVGDPGSTSDYLGDVQRAAVDAIAAAEAAESAAALMNTGWFATRVLAAGSSIPVSLPSIQTAGFATAGDGGSAIYYRGGTSTPGGFQSTDGQWWALERGDINVRQYGAVGNGVGDDTVAVRLAASVLQTAVSVGGAGSTTPARMVFPSGVYKITGSINLQKIGAAMAGGTWEVDMSGAVILFAAAGKTLFDCLGSRWGKFIGGQIVGDSVNQPAIGIQPGRLYASPTFYGFGDGFHYDHVSFAGYWTRAAWYNLQGETQSYDHCFVSNAHPTGSAVITDGLNHLGAITDFQAPAQAANAVESCIQHTFVSCDFRVVNGSTMDFYGANQIHFYDSYAVSSTSCIRNIALGTAGSIISDLHYDVHCELNTNNIEFLRTSSVGNFTVEGFYVNDIASQASNALIKVGANVANLVVDDGEIHTGSSTVPLFSGSVFWGGSIRGNSVSWLGMQNIDTALTFTAGLLGAYGAVNKVVVVGLNAPRVLTLPPANGAPRGWELTVIDLLGLVTAVNTINIVPAGADTINAVAGGIFLNARNDGVVFVTDGVSKWAIKSRQSSGYATYTPVVTASTGTITTVSATGRWRQFGKSVHLTMTITITTNGTGGGFLQVTLPALGNAADNYVMAGRASAVSGKMLQGWVPSGLAVVRILDYAAVYPGANGEIIYLSGTYEVV